MFIVRKLNPSVVQSLGVCFESVSQMTLVHGQTTDGAEMIFVVLLIVNFFYLERRWTLILGCIPVVERRYPKDSLNSTGRIGS